MAAAAALLWTSIHAPTHPKHPTAVVPSTGIRGFVGVVFTVIKKKKKMSIARKYVSHVIQ